MYPTCLCLVEIPRQTSILVCEKWFPVVAEVVQFLNFIYAILLV